MQPLIEPIITPLRKISKTANNNYRRALNYIAYHQNTKSKIRWMALFVFLVSMVELFIFYEWFIAGSQNLDGWAPAIAHVSAIMKALVIVGMFKMFIIVFMLLPRIIQGVIGIITAILVVYLLIDIGSSVTIPQTIKKAEKTYAKYENKLDDPNAYKISDNTDNKHTELPNIADLKSDDEEVRALYFATLERIQEEQKEELKEKEHPLLFTLDDTWKQLSRNSYIESNMHVYLIALASALSVMLMQYQLNRLKHTDGLNKKKQNVVDQYNEMRSIEPKIHSAKSELIRMNKDPVYTIKAAQEMRLKRYLEGIGRTVSHIHYYKTYKAPENTSFWPKIKWHIKYHKGLLHINIDSISEEKLQRAYASANELQLRNTNDPEI